MFTEGRGVVAPSPVRIRIHSYEVIDLHGVAVERAKYRGYKGGDRWRRGMTEAESVLGVENVAQEVIPILRGLVGEYVVGHWLRSRSQLSEGFEFDRKLKPEGDKGIDLSGVGMTLQVKTQKRPRSEVLVRRFHRGTILPSKAEAMVFCEWRGKDVVSLLGWNRSDVIREKSVLKPSSLADHENMVCSVVHLEPMLSLVAEINSRSPNCGK